MKNLILPLAIIFLTSQAFAAVPTNFKFYEGNYLGYGSTSDSGPYNCSVKIQIIKKINREFVRLDIVDGNELGVIEIPLKNLNKALIETSKDDITFHLSEEGKDLSPLPGTEYCRLMNNSLEVDVWTIDAEISGRTIAPGDLNFLSIDRKYNCGGIFSGHRGSSSICGQLVRQ